LILSTLERMWERHFRELRASEAAQAGNA
jgi:hypothetical protein